MINDKKIILIILKILDQIQQDNEDASEIEKSISRICKEEGISFEQVFYILFFDALASKVGNLFWANR